jgi:class 3 adenylate cyclase/ligand-binding sensor domain-containing protein
MQPFRKAFLILLSFLFLLNHSNSKGSEKANTEGCPFIRKIYLNNYGIENNNFSIVQDSLGNIFIGNSNGIIKYNGAFWDLIKIDGQPQLKKAPGGRIYTNTYHQIGYLSAGDHSIQFKPIDHQPVQQQIKNFSFIDSNRILFNTQNSLFVLSNNKVKKISESRNQLKILQTDQDKIYISIDNTGLFNFTKKEELIKVLDYKKLKSNIKCVLQKGDSLIISLSNYNGLKIYTKGTMQKLPGSTREIFRDIAVSDMVLLEKNRIAIGTETSGIIILDKNGEIIKIIDKRCGLFDSKINKLFIDRNNNLWALHNFGLSRIETDPGFYFYTNSNGINGNVTAIEQFNNKLYAGTNKGIYYLSLDGKKDNETNLKSFAKFERIPGVQTNIFNFYTADNTIYAFTSRGIYKIDNNRAKLFYNKSNNLFSTCKHSEIHPGLIYIGRKDGLFAIKHTHHLMVDLGNLTEIQEKVADIEEDSRKNTWVITKNKGIYKIPPFEKFSRSLPVQHFPENTISPDKNINWIKGYAISDEMLFSTSNGLFRFNYKTESFERYYLTHDSLHKNNQWIFPIAEDKNGNVWFNVVSKTEQQNQIIVKLPHKEEISKIKLPISRLTNFHIQTIHTKNKNTIWFGGTDGLIKFDLDIFNPRELKYNLLLHKVTLNKDSLVDYNCVSSKTKKKQKRKFSYKLNDIRFEYAATNYFSENQMAFKTRLSGYDEWSEWTNKNYKEYTNLREGKYTFLVKAKDIYGNESEILKYNFTINPPFYRSTWAYILYIVFLGLFLLLLFKWRAYYFAKEKFKLENIIHERTEEVLLQKEKADNLLNQLLPKDTANELKSGKKPGPYHFNMSTVLFGDIQGFSSITENMEISSIIDKLDKFFLEFDSIVEKYNIEKIKTMGDAYMCAGGIPVENHTNPVEVVLAAMEMQYHMKKFNTPDDNKWGLRIGIDTGEVTAGVIGKSKATYDIWGNTVNLASRMESAGIAGRINVSGNTYEVIKEFFLCEHRGKIPVKNHGNVDMYFVNSFKPQFARSDTALLPNDSFITQLQLLRLNDLEEEILEKMEKGLPSDLFYHNVKHTIDVMTQVELIGKAEKISPEEMLILKTAALFHDTGHMVDYDNHEEEGVKIARRILPEYHYTPEQIAQIEKLIRVTEMPPKPNTLLEMIICDADLDYLGRPDFVPVAYNLYKELKVRNKIESFEEWKKVQIDFIKKHSYFTKTAQKLRDVNKKHQLEKIIKEMKD